MDWLFGVAVCCLVVMAFVVGFLVGYNQEIK